MDLILLQLLVFTVLFISFTYSKDTSAEETYPQLLFSNHTAIGLFDTKTENVSILADGLDHVLFIDYHSSKYYIFWSDYNKGTISRLPYRAGIKNAQVIITGANNPTGVAVDDINDFLYWAEWGEDRIRRSHLNGSSTTYVIGVSSPRGLALDISNRMVYGVNSQRYVYRCSLDGRECKNILHVVGQLHYLAIDLEESRIYWTYREDTDIISSSFLNGTNVQHTLINILSAYGIDVSSTHIYYVDWYRGLCKTEKVNSTYHVLLYAHIQLTAVKIFKLEDECSFYNRLISSSKRSSDYVLDVSEDIVLSDHELEMSWYLITSDNGDMMPNFAPGFMHCGTVNPIWLNGNMPSFDDGDVTREACLQTKEDTCEQTIYIQIRNCSGYYLYLLQSSPENSSFCFGNGPVVCPDEMSSDTGYYPGCKYNFPTEIVLVHIEAELIEEQNFQIPIYGNQSYSSLLPVFRCSFVDISEGSYVYDVDWYINGVIVKHHLNVPFSNINSTVLRDTDWTSQFKMNMELKCTIRMRYSIDSAPGSLLYSQPYKAGIFPAKYEYAVNEGESIDITFTSTAPVGCIPSHDAVKTNCEQNFYIFQQMADQTSVSRKNNIVKADIVFEAQFCGLSINSLNWGNETILRVHGLSDSVYNFHDRSTILKISTLEVSESNYIWRDVQVPDIMVTVIDKDYVLIDRQCMSYNDPHITTFDGRLYHYMNVGEFVMYKNDKGPYSVHALFTNCGFGWAGSSCHCGIAVRSRDSLFVLRTCQTISRTEKHLLPEPITKLLRCHDKDLVIEHNRNSYKITLPIGTEINFTISRRSKFISMIVIKPSICDINKARGLCGVPSTTKDQSDDFTHRQNGPINNDQEFADSWRINPTMIAEQLFCVDNVQCNLTDITEFCSETLMTEEETMTSFSTACSTSQGKKRSVNYVDKIVQRTFSGDDDVTDIPCFTYDESVFSTEVAIPETFRNGWTENTAWQTCIDEMQNALPPEVANLVDVSVAEFVESCVLDIKLVGDTTFLPDTIGTMLTFVMTEIRRNESLYLLNTTEGSQTLVEYVTSFLCPNNCSENGNCAMGVCECNGKYIGDDCSESITIPPSNISLTSNGLCIPGTNDCRNPNIFGSFLSKTIWYNIKYFQKVTNSIKYISKSDVLQANFSNMFMVSVDLMSSKGKRATTETIVAEGYEISLSYDGTNFGESVSIIIHDENCYSCHSTTIACFEQDLCSPTVISSAKNDNNESIVVIAASIGGLLLVIMVIIGLIYYKVRSNSTRAKINATADKLEERPNLYLDQSNGSQVWMTRDKTISDLQLEIDENRGDSPFEMFEKPLHFVPPPSHYKRMPENFKWQ